LTSSSARLQPASYRLTPPHLGGGPGINLSASYVKIKKVLLKKNIWILFSLAPALIVADEMSEIPLLFLSHMFRLLSWLWSFFFSSSSFPPTKNTN
jgi:hypothetical protein